MSSKYKLQILMPSYNKEKYIGEAIESILKQKTNFDYQIIVTDDCSTDGTIDVVKSYQEKYPGKLILLASDKNQRLLANIIKAYEYMDCEYFCCLDADDYLTDKFFYQSAIDFLDKNRNYYIYAANTSILQKNGHLYAQNPDLTCDYIDSSFEDMLENKAILGNTISSVFRNSVIDMALINELRLHTKGGYEEHSFREDDFRNRIHLEKGLAHFVNKVVGVYRSTDVGLYQGSNKLKQFNMKITAYIDMYYFFKKKYPKFMNLAFIELTRLKNVLIKNDLNNLLEYPLEDIVQFFNIFERMYLFDKTLFSAFFSDISIPKKQRNFHILKNLFSVVNEDSKHKLISIFGVKIKIKRKS